MVNGEREAAPLSLGYLSSYLRLQNWVLWGLRSVKYTTSLSKPLFSLPGLSGTFALD